MSQNKLSIYQKLLNAYKQAYPKKNHETAVQHVKIVWDELKKNKPELVNNANQKIGEWVQCANERKSGLLKYYSSLPPKKTVSPANDEIEVLTNENPNPDDAEADQNIGADDNAASDSTNSASKQQRPRPKDDLLTARINDLNRQIVYLAGMKDINMATPQQVIDLKKKRAEVSDVTKELRKIRGSRNRQAKKRRHHKTVLKKYPEIAAELGRGEVIGRPRAETDQPELLKAILGIVSHDAGANERRRSEGLNSARTLDDALAKLEELGYQISRSALYLRLLPKRSLSTEGKRHVVTVPVRLRRARNDLHKSHADTIFAKTTINAIEEIASVLGSDQILFISQDDKARVPIGKTAAIKQAPMLMHLEYLVKLPDHDWVVASKHKLIPSVYGVMEIKDGMPGNRQAVTYGGPTFICIRSGKHCSSTAAAHARDLDKLFEDENFLTHTRMQSGEVKPVLILIVDGGADENPRYKEVINQAIHHFMKYDLDAIFIATNAPGRSAYNRVERRMAPLSRELCGLILEHDHYGSHLNSQGVTIDDELESQNFRHAGETLAEIWSNVVINKHPVIAKYVLPEDSERDIPDVVTAEWRALHVRESHYFLQIVKCEKTDCCSPMRGNYGKVFARFMPPPVQYDQKSMKVLPPDDTSSFCAHFLTRLRLDDDALKNKTSMEVPYDISCPSVRELINSRLCGKCGIYFASQRSMKIHKRWCKNSALNMSVFGTTPLLQRANKRPVRIAAKRQREKMVLWTSRLNDEQVDWFEEEDLEEVEQLEPEENDQEVNHIVSMKDHLSVPWEDDAGHE